MPQLLKEQMGLKTVRKYSNW